MLNLKRLRIRAAFINALRSFFTKNGFLEVDTPIRQPVILPESNIHPIIADGLFLQTSPELCMKRLLAIGAEQIFQICKCFRAEEKGEIHLEEFTMLEWYRTDASYLDLMADCESLLMMLCKSLKSHIDTINSAYFHLPWKRLTVADAFDSLSPISLVAACEQNIFDEILVEYVEPSLGVESPVFLYDYPVELGSLAKRKTNQPKIAERFELYMNGLEIANGFSELTDANEQRQRFAKEISTINKQASKKAVQPEKFLKSLDTINSAAGIALGVDRLFMVLLGESDIDKTLSFCENDL